MIKHNGSHDFLCKSMSNKFDPSWGAGSLTHSLSYDIKH
jgi:hypothetical protein